MATGGGRGAGGYPHAFLHSTHLGLLAPTCFLPKIRKDIHSAAPHLDRDVFSSRSECWKGHSLTILWLGMCSALRDEAEHIGATTYAAARAELCRRRHHHTGILDNPAPGSCEANSGRGYDPSLGADSIRTIGPLQQNLDKACRSIPARWSRFHQVYSLD